MPQVDNFFDSVMQSVLENKWGRRITVGTLIILVYLFPVIPAKNLPIGLDEPVTRALVLLGFALLYLELIESNINHLVKDTVSRNLHQDNERMNSRIDDIVEEEDISTLYSIDYSGQNATQMVQKAIKNGLTVNLLLKLPQSALNKHQRRQMENPLTFFYTQLFEKGDIQSDQLNVKYYWYDGVVRGRRLDDKHLFLGWYIRTSRPEDPKAEKSNILIPDYVRYVRENSETKYENWKFPVDLDYAPLQAETGNRQKIWGHNIPAIEFDHEDDEFDEVNRVFSDELFNPLWKNGITPNELYQLELGLKSYAKKETDSGIVFPEESNFMINFLENNPGAGESFLKEISPTEGEKHLIERDI